ncbi:MAG: DUF2029 domain-containing protein [Elusimicrobia bacterium]|nr:DUF2029 domain-containing protein [Elusimicrobiota bacterium]
MTVFWKFPKGLFFSFGIALAVVYTCFLLVIPFNDHIPGFLAIYAVLILLSVIMAAWLKKNEVPSSRWIIFAFAVLFRLTLLWTPPMSTDIYRYVWDGRVQQAGINPYLHSPLAPELKFLRDDLHSSINHPGLSTIYPPLAQWTFRLGAAIAPTVFVQKIIFTLFDLAAVWVLLMLLELKRISPAWGAVYAWHPLVIVEFAGSGHLDSLMIFLMIVSLYLLERKKMIPATIALAGAALSKIAPLSMVPWLLMQKNKRLLAIYGLVIIAACLPFARGLLEMASRGEPVFAGFSAFAKDWTFNSSLYALLGLAIPSMTIRKSILALGLASFSFYWARRNREDSMRYAFGCFYALLLCSSIVEPWYITWLIPFLSFYPLWSALAWSWLAGFAYVVADRHYVLWAWIWVAQYILVYALLAIEIIRAPKAKGPCNIIRS